MFESLKSNKKGFASLKISFEDLHNVLILWKIQISANIILYQSATTALFLQCFSNTFSELQTCHYAPSVLVCIPGLKPCKWCAENWCAYVGGKSFEKLKLYFETLWLYLCTGIAGCSFRVDTHFSEIWPHRYKLETHLIFGRIVSQPWSETLKIWNRKKRRKKQGGILEAGTFALT